MNNRINQYLPLIRVLSCVMRNQIVPAFIVEQAREANAAPESKKEQCDRNSLLLTILCERY